MSQKLVLTAEWHAWDSVVNRPSKGDCSLHSWSNNDPNTNWKGCCYYGDHRNSQCMSSKPKEIAGYPGNGYEISASGASTPEGALQLWKGSPGHTLSS